MPCQLCCKSFVSQLDIDQDQYFEAMIDLSRWENDYMFRQLREVVNRTDWRSHGTVTKVNAFYVPWENSMDLPFRSIHIAGDSSRDVFDLVHCMVTADTTVKGVCRPGVGLLSVTSDSPLPPDSCYVIMAGTNDVAIGQRNIYKHLERCFTSKLRTAKVVVSTLPHRHVLPAQHPINKETSLINAYIEEFYGAESSGGGVLQPYRKGLSVRVRVYWASCWWSVWEGSAVLFARHRVSLLSCRPSLAQTDHLRRHWLPLRDFNIDVFDYTNSLTQQLRDILTSFGLVWSENTPTRWEQHQRRLMGPVSSMVLSPVSESELVRIVRELSVWLLMRCFKHISVPLTKLINLSFAQGVFP
ncbi:NEDD8 protease nep2 [Homalodisca vitripennis]|nr:NEDD8 protease nep2 [Homalodisca vitripennis]